MERIYETYLKIVKNACTDSHRTESVNPADLPTLAELAQNHCTVPYILSDRTFHPAYRISLAGSQY